MVEWFGVAQGMGFHERDGGEDVCVGDVTDVGEVEEVVVVAELEFRLTFGIGAQHAGDHLHVAFAEDASGAEGDGEHGAVLAVGFEDEVFGDAFGFGVVFFLLGAAEDGPSLVGVDEVADGVVDDGCGAGVYECLDSSYLCCALNEVLRSFDVDFVE